MKGELHLGIVQKGELHLYNDVQDFAVRILTHDHPTLHALPHKHCVCDTRILSHSTLHATGATLRLCNPHPVVACTHTQTLRL